MEEESKRKNSLVHRVPNPTGRPLRFKKPEELWSLFVEYCDYIDDNPWQVKTASNAIDTRGEKKNSNYMRQNVDVKQKPYTLQGFCAYAGIHYKWADFRKNYSEKQGFEPVIAQIENVVITQQLEGALVHQFDSGIVARINGFSDKQQLEVTGKEGVDFKWPKLTLDDLKVIKEINGL